MTEKTITAIQEKQLSTLPTVKWSQEALQWDFGTLPEELKEMLRGIGDNDGFSIDIRIKQCFALVAKWIEKLEQSHSNQLRLANEETEGAFRERTEFAEAIAHLVDANPGDLSEVVAKVTEMQAFNMSLTQQVSASGLQHKIVFTPDTYDKLQSTIASLEAALNSAVTKARRRKIELQQCKTAFLACRSKCDTDLQTLRAECDRADAHVNQLQAEIEAIQQQNTELRADCLKAKQEQADETKNFRDDYEAMLADQAARYEDLQKSASETAEKQQEAIAALEAKVNELLATNAKQTATMKQTAHELQEQRAELEDLRARRYD
jgi:DNA repair exonuclease SbcCD ATPase subunit